MEQPSQTPESQEQNLNATPTTPVETPDDVNAKLANEEEQRKKELIDATRVMFGNVSEYLKSELQATSLDFELLRNMNDATKEKYSELNTVAKNLSLFLEDLQKKYRDFEPYLKKIDQIDTNVSELEHTVQLLDDYTKRLEKFKKLAAQRKEAKKGGKL